MCIDTGYYEAYFRVNVRLVDVSSNPILEIDASGLRLGDERFTFDMLVYATGFDAMTGALLAVDPRGRSGLSLREKWADGPRSYLGLTIAGFPNLFTVTGPGSPSVLSNMLVSIEQHVDLVADCIGHVRDAGATTIEPTQEAEERWVEHVRAEGEATLYPRARSWYMGANVPGKPRVLLPYVTGVGAYRRECDRIVENGFEGFAVGAFGRRDETIRTG
jgi:cyclohexanone monooxygenase